MSSCPDSYRDVVEGSFKLDAATRQAQSNIKQ